MSIPMNKILQIVAMILSLIADGMSQKEAIIQTSIKTNTPLDVVKDAFKKYGK